MKNDGSDDGISDGDAGRLFCTGIFLHDKHGEKWAQCVWGASFGSMKPVGPRRTTVCVPCVSMMASYVKKRLLSCIRAPFDYQRKVTCTETCLRRQNVFISLQGKAEYFLEYLSLSVAKNVEWFTVCTIIGKTPHSRFFSPTNALGKIWCLKLHIIISTARERWCLCQ